MSPTKSTRPPLNTVANLDTLITATRGSATGLEDICKTTQSLTYLATQEDKYLSLSTTTSATTPEHFLYHGFWSGPFTWRVEAFIKSYLFTQNLSYSTLILWIDISNKASALEDALSHPLATQFASVLKSGHLEFRPWTLPDKIPLPKGLDNSDGMAYIDNLERRTAYGFPECRLIADSVMRDEKTGEEFLVTNAWAKSVNPSLVSVSDIVRFVVCHLHGGCYLDIDMLLLKDFRPLFLSGEDWAERWGPYAAPCEYNTAAMYLRKMGSLSSFMLRAGVRLGLLFHPRTLGWQLVKAGRGNELKMLESAAFDPVWVEVSGVREGEITTPSFNNFMEVFEADFKDEKLGKERKLDEFFKGSYAYHMHNQWKAVAEPGSWMRAIMDVHDDFFAKKGPNDYGETWDFDALNAYT